MEAAGDYVRLHVGDRSHLLRETMKSLEVRLDSEQWVRVHRSTLVRLEFVREIRTSDSGHYELVLQDGSRRSLSRRTAPPFDTRSSCGPAGRVSA